MKERDTILNFVKGKNDGYFILNSIKTNKKTVVVKVEDFLLAYEEGDKEINVFNMRMNRPITSLWVDFKDDVKEIILEDLGQELCEWYFEGEGQEMLLKTSIEIMAGENADTILEALDEAMEDLDNIIKRVTDEYIREKFNKPRYK